MSIITTTTITTSSCGGAANLPLTNCSNTLFQFNMDEIITSPIVIKNAHDVIFDGMGNKFTCNFAGTDRCIFFIIYENCKNIEIRNFKAFAGNEGYGFQRLLIQTSNVKREYIYIHDNEIYNFSIAISLAAEKVSSQDPLVTKGQGVLYSEVYNNKIIGTNGTESGSGYGIHLANAQYCKVYNNHIEHTTRHAIYHAWGENNEITNNTIVEHWKGVGIYDTDAQAIAACHPSAVRGNVRSAIAIYRDSQHIKIKENRFFDVYNVCIHVYPSPDANSYLTYYDQYDIKIQDNHFYNTRFHLENDGSIPATYPAVMVGFIKGTSAYGSFKHPITVEITGNSFLSIDTNSLMGIRVYDIGISNTGAWGTLKIKHNHFVFSSQYIQGYETDMVIVQVDKHYRDDVRMNAEITDNTFIALNELSGYNCIGALFDIAFYFNKNVSMSIIRNKFLNQRQDNTLPYRAYFGFDPYTYSGTQSNIVYQPEVIEMASNPNVGYHLTGDIIFWNQGNTYSRNRCIQSGAPGAYVSY